MNTSPSASSSSRGTVDTALGWLLALAALAFGVVGWLSELADNSRANVWFYSGAILGIIAIGVVLDEGRAARGAVKPGAMASLSWLAMLGAFAMGVVGFIAGLAMGRSADEWLFGGIILAVISVALMADEGRRMRAASRSVPDEIVGSLLVLLALGTGVVGFLVGITGDGTPNGWLSGGVIAAIAGTALMFDGERRAMATTAADRLTGEVPGGLGYPETR